MTRVEDPRAVFCAREYPRLVGALTLYTGDRELAVELAQEALFRACRSWRRLQLMDAPGAWVHRVALNLANRYVSRSRKESELLARAVVGDSGASWGVDLGDVMAVRTAVAALPNRQRAAVVLRYFLDLPVGEVASVMDVAEGTVRALTHQGIANLRRVLGDVPELEGSDDD